MMKRKLRTLFTQPPKKNRRNLPFCIAMLAICLSTLSGCASQKAPAPDVSAQSETDHTPAAGQDLPFSGTQAAKNSTTISLYLESDSGTTLAYIDSFDGKQLAFDDAEWVDVPSDRAKELNVEKEAEDAGFYIYNEDASIETLPVAEQCTCTILDWEKSYEPKEITVEKLCAVLEERKDTKIPYLLTIEEQEIVKIEEHYVP